jgi:hypothetical protein
MSQLTLDTSIHNIELRIDNVVYANRDIIERVTITYGCTDGTAPGFGATYSPSCSVVLNSDSIVGHIADGAFTQGVYFSVHTDLLDAPVLGTFLIEEPPMKTEDYQITFEGQGLLGSLYDYTYMDFSDCDPVIPLYDAPENFKNGLNLFCSQFHTTMVMPPDSYLPNGWRNFRLYLPIIPAESKGTPSYEKITAREWLAGIALLLGCNVVEAFGDLRLVPLYMSYATRNTQDYFMGDEYNSGFDHTDLVYQPESLHITTQAMSKIVIQGDRRYEGGAYTEKEQTYKSNYTPTPIATSHIAYDLNISIQWVSHSLRDAYWGTKKGNETPTKQLPSYQFAYTPSNWDFSGYNSIFRPGNFINVRKEIKNVPTQTIEVIEVLAYIMEMTLEWNGNFNVTINSAYNGDADGVTSSISSSANGHGKSGLGAIVSGSLINGVRIEDGTIWAKKINVHDLAADNAFIGFLNANEALLGELRAEHAWIKTMNVGTLDAQSITTVLMNAEYALIGDGTIKTATVIREAVDQATILNLCTTFIKLQSQSGNMTFKDNTIQINDEHGVTRVQIGKDEAGDYDLYLWDENGRLMWSASGLAEAGIKSKIIRNDMIADDAGIEGQKINIETLVPQINSTGYKLTSSILAYDGTGQTFESKFQEVSYNLGGVAKNADGYRLVVDIDGYCRVDQDGNDIEHAYLTAEIYKDEYNEKTHQLTHLRVTDRYKPSDFVWKRYSDHKNDWTEKVSIKSFDYIREADIAHARPADNEPDVDVKGWVNKMWNPTTQSYETVPNEVTVTHKGDDYWNDPQQHPVVVHWDNARHAFVYQLSMEDVCIGAVFECTARVAKQVRLHAEPYQIEPLVYNGQVQEANLANMDEATIAVSGMLASEVGTHEATIGLADGYVWYDETETPKDVPWVIEPGVAPTEVPTQSGTLTYSGSSQTPTWNNYDPTVLTLGGETSGTNAGTYTATFTPTEGYTWEDGTRTPKNATWTIGKAPGNITLSKNSVSLTPENPSDTVTFSNNTGTVSVTSADTSVATASVSGNTITITRPAPPQRDTWIPKTWNGFNPTGSKIWTDGDNIYYSYVSDQYVLDKSTSTWNTKTWNNLTPGMGTYIWTDGDNYYYSDGTTQLVLNKATSTWNTKTWNGATLEFGNDVWTDGQNIYYSSIEQYVLNKSTSTWTSKTWNGYNPTGSNIWKDGNNIYYSGGSAHYILDKTTSTWNTKTWNGLTSFPGKQIWTDGNNIYYSLNENQYVLDKATSTWVSKTWNGLTNFNGANVWTDGTDIYYSDGSVQYVLS